MTTILLTIPLENETHKEFHELARANNTTARRLGAMLIKQGIEDIKSGALNVSQPSLEKGAK